ncbi:F510_1955 family glycosylhydrolase [Piscinibacter sp.]|uniref:F510_1955 family glycosylhydrolase n=1 Tax=Piscinibacter sp. TaxID=1903157 RepID=UPI002CC45741|nr:glycosyl hydrolase [Albitalea sp.]HUG24486.1 glycosyl hydrolase [Albitalea sp.]
MLHNRQALHAWMLAFALCVSAPPVLAGPIVTLAHVHGLAYSTDGKQLLVPGHDGLAVYTAGRWSQARGPAYHFNGFSATRDALYSSGHPAPAAGLADPVGLIKSSDGGKTWQSLGLAGESDFHTLATSFATNAVYVANREANSRMSQPGIYYTLTDGRTWQRGADQGRGYMLHSLAVHPTDPAVVAAATDVGLYLSRDSADTFEPLVGDRVVITAGFAPDGQHLWFSTYAGAGGALARIALKAGAKAEDVTVPALADDAIAYIALNPVRPAEIAIATFKRSVFVSKDRGRTWAQIAQEGAANR